MNYLNLRKLQEKLFFTVEDLVGLLNIKPQSAWVLCSRYVREGIFIRLKNNFYVLEDSWRRFSRDDFLRVSNFLQVPSYVSFMTALSIYGITTQVQRNFFESASIKRSKGFDVNGVVFNFYKLKSQYYFDFIKRDSIFIATKEKAFIDSVYLYSFGKYKFDVASINVDKLDKNKLKRDLKLYPAKTKSIVGQVCKI